MRAARKTILSADRNEVWTIGKVLGLTVVLQLPGASYCLLQLPTSHHEAVAMHATLEIILLIDPNEFWKIEKASGLVVLQLPTASCDRYGAVPMRATGEKPFGTFDC
jgi:hypothetical protein